MAFKASKRTLAIGAAIAAVAVLIGLSAVSGAFNSKPTNNPPSQIIGPDTAQNAGSAPARLAQTTTPAPAFASPETRPDAPPSAGTNALAFTDDSLDFKAELPEGPKNDPILRYLRDDAERTLGRLKSNARAEHDRLKRKGQEAQPWAVRIKWAYTAKAGGIVSLLGEESEFNGGAHPNLYYDSHIAEAGTGKIVKIGEMMTSGKAPSPTMATEICEALRGAKLNRIHAATVFDEPLHCSGADANAKTEAATLALAPSNQPEKFGGVYVYYPPYAVGAGAEGPYRLTIQQAAFVADLQPAFQSLFGGRAPEIH